MLPFALVPSGRHREMTASGPAAEKSAAREVKKVTRRLEDISKSLLALQERFPSQRNPSTSSSVGSPTASPSGKTRSTAQILLGHVDDPLYGAFRAQTVFEYARCQSQSLRAKLNLLKVYIALSGLKLDSKHKLYREYARFEAGLDNLLVLDEEVRDSIEGSPTNDALQTTPEQGSTKRGEASDGKSSAAKSSTGKKVKDRETSVRKAGKKVSDAGKRMIRHGVARTPKKGDN